ncbi:MAG TPA: tetratricopeptide repeat protein [Clostridia bacterium]|nr:tetratricopeptide repeat protein [Clostridia bacterium]
MSALQEQYDDAMFDFSTGAFESAIAKLKAVLASDPAHFDAQLALGMAYYRTGDYAAAIAEGHKAEKMKPHEQLVHTNLSLFYMKAGDKTTAEHHGLQARIASWRADAQQAKSDQPESEGQSELELAKPKPQNFKLPGKFPDMPWKKKPASGSSQTSGS